LQVVKQQKLSQITKMMCPSSSQVGLALLLLLGAATAPQQAFGHRRLLSRSLVQDEKGHDVLTENSVLMKAIRGTKVGMGECDSYVPKCVLHVRKLLGALDMSYTDTHSQSALEHECEKDSDRESPLTTDSGFDKTAQCKAFATKLYQARERELLTGDLEFYKTWCREYYTYKTGQECHVPIVKKEEPKPKVEGPEPMFSKETMPKVSPTLQCVMNLAAQYFVVYTLLAIVRTLDRFGANFCVGAEQILQQAATTVTYAPMLSVLFLGARMRAIQLTQGETEKYKLPQPWVQNCMFMATYAVLAQVLLVALIPIFTGEAAKTDEEGNLQESAGGIFGIALTAIRYLIMAALYGGFTAVCAGVYMMEPPEEIWGADGGPPVSPAVACVMNLCMQFFGIYLGVAVARTLIQLTGRTRFKTKLEEVFTIARFTVNFAPMLCILFVGARMRALQIDPKHGNPQRWAQMCFYLCTYSVLVQNLLVIGLPLIFGDCQAEKGAVEGDVIFTGLNSTVELIVTIARYVCMLCLYGGFTAVMVSVFLIEHPDGPEKTPPISPAMQCVMNLAVQYFTIMLLLFVSITVRQFTGMGEFAIIIFEAGQKTVMFCPMLAMLFIGCRMRALQLTKATDGTIPPGAGPQGWAQDGMFLSTWSVLVQVIMVLLAPVFIGMPKMDEDGNLVTPPNANIVVAVLLDIIRYACLIAMYGGAIAVMAAVFVMTPETLPPYANREGLVPGVDVPKPPTPDTPGQF